MRVAGCAAFVQASARRLWRCRGLRGCACALRELLAAHLQNTRAAAHARCCSTSPPADHPTLPLQGYGLTETCAATFVSYPDMPVGAAACSRAGVGGGSVCAARQRWNRRPCFLALHECCLPTWPPPSPLFPSPFACCSPSRCLQGHLYTVGPPTPAFELRLEVRALTFPRRLSGVLCWLACEGPSGPAPQAGLLPLDCTCPHHSRLASRPVLTHCRLPGGAGHGLRPAGHPAEVWLPALRCRVIGRVGGWLAGRPEVRAGFQRQRHSSWPRLGRHGLRSSTPAQGRGAGAGHGPVLRLLQGRGGRGAVRCGAGGQAGGSAGSAGALGTAAAAPPRPPRRASWVPPRRTRRGAPWTRTAGSTRVGWAAVQPGGRVGGAAPPALPAGLRTCCQRTRACSPAVRHRAPPTTPPAPACRRRRGRADPQRRAAHHRPQEE